MADLPCPRQGTERRSVRSRSPLGHVARTAPAPSPSLASGLLLLLLEVLVQERVHAVARGGALALAGERVTFVTGHPMNHKLTTAEDLEFAQRLAAQG